MTANPETLQVAGAPLHELTRSPAALAVGRAASQMGLRMFHLERRAPIAVPEHWEPQGLPEGAVAPPEWGQGYLIESKYGSFRHDQLLGSFHPAHRAKWTAHELCHGLVGFAWRPDAGPLFHALAAWTAEIVPVALWYYLDEIQLRRCPQHQGRGPLHRAFCLACERAAGAFAESSAADERWRQEARAFVADQVDGVRASLASGRLMPARHGNLDLAADGAAYAAAHMQRLSSPEMARWMAAFHPQRSGPAFDSLQAMLAHTEAVFGALVEGRAPEVSPQVFGRWVAADLGWRLIQAASTEGQLESSGLDAVLEALQAMDFAEAAALYPDIPGAMPSAETLFAVGYPVPGTSLGLSWERLAEGVTQACPETTEELGGRALGTFVAMAGDPDWRREGVGRHFARTLGSRLKGGDPGLAPEDVAMATFESAVSHARVLSAAHAPLVLSAELQADDTGAAWELDPSVELVPFDLDIIDLLEDAPGPPPGEDGRWVLAVARTLGGAAAGSGSDAGEVAVVPLAGADAARISARVAPNDGQALRMLTSLGFLGPAVWSS